MYPKDVTLRTIIRTFIDKCHPSLVALGIVVNNCIIIQSYVLVNKEQRQCVEMVFSHGASKTTLYKAQ